MYLCEKMVGNKNSGRKKDPMSEYSRMGKKTLYIKQTKNLKGDWVADTIFQWFRRKHGALWQKQLRAWMKLDVDRWKTKSWWQCKCPNTGVMGNYIPNRIPKCPNCNEWHNEIDKLRYE